MATKPNPVVESVKLGTVAEARPDFPGLDRIGAKVARGLSAAFAASGGTSKVDGGDIRTMSFRDWKTGLPRAVAVARYRARGMKGGVLFSVPPALLATLVDLFYGGDGAIDKSRVTCGAAEQRLFDRLATATGEAVSLAWAEVQPLDLTHETAIFAPEDLTFGKADDAVVVHRFAIDDPHAGACAAEIVYSLAALRGIAGLDGTVEAADDAPDPAWRMRLSDAVMQSRLPVRTVIARPTVPLSRLISLAPGDFIPVTLPARVPLTVAGRLLAHGTIGVANGRAAIMIDKIEPGFIHD
jgi:flagellar motor switch protein FliM